MVTLKLQAVPLWRAAIVFDETTLEVREVNCILSTTSPVTIIVQIQGDTFPLVSPIYTDFSSMHASCLGTDPESFEIDGQVVSTGAVPWATETLGSAPTLTFSHSLPLDYIGTHTIVHKQGFYTETNNVIVCAAVLPDLASTWVKGADEISIVRQLGVFTYEIEWSASTWNTEPECGNLEYKYFLESDTEYDPTTAGNVVESSDGRALSFSNIDAWVSTVDSSKSPLVKAYFLVRVDGYAWI